MGHISLPSLDDIVQEKDPRKQSEMLLNTVGILIKNLSELNGYLTSKNIRANSIVADRLDVNELSAITANLGTITAGLIQSVQIFGSYIATANGTYPRVEFTSADNFIKAAQDANRYVIVTPISGGSPAIQLYDGVATKSLLFYVDSGGSNIAAIGNLDLSASGGYVRYNDWDEVYSIGDGQTLQSALDGLSSAVSGKANAFSGETVSLAVMLSDSSTATLNFSNGVLTSVS